MSRKLVAYFSASGTTAEIAEEVAKAADAALYEIKSQEAAWKCQIRVIVRN